MWPTPRRAASIRSAPVLRVRVVRSGCTLLRVCFESETGRCDDKSGDDSKQAPSERPRGRNLQASGQKGRHGSVRESGSSEGSEDGLALYHQV